MGRGSSHSEANASKALQVPGEASHAGVFHPQASELSHLLPAPRGAAAAGRAHSELDTRGKAAALRRRTALRGTCPPPGTGTGPGPQARQGLSRTPSPGAGYAARPLPTRTAVKGRTGPHLLLPAPRSAESKRTSPRPPHTGDTPATDTHPSPRAPRRRRSGAGVPAEVPRGPSLTREPQGRPQRRQQYHHGRSTTQRARRRHTHYLTPKTPTPPPPTGRRLTAQAPPAAPGRPRMRRTASHLPGLAWRRCAREPALARGGRGGEGVGARMRRGVGGRVRAAGWLWSVY